MATGGTPFAPPEKGFIWEPDTGTRSAHAKSLLPNEEGAWEVTWYHSAALAPTRAAATAVWGGSSIPQKVEAPIARQSA